jgi:hypothetical protein
MVLLEGASSKQIEHVCVNVGPDRFHKITRRGVPVLGGVKQARTCIESLNPDLDQVPQISALVGLRSF